MRFKLVKDINKIRENSIAVGIYFREYLIDERTENWSASEECSTFTKSILDYVDEYDFGIGFVLRTFSNIIVNNINNKTIPVIDHAWDDYCKGFIAGEILGSLTEQSIKQILEADELWENDFGDYGYYQDALMAVI